MWLSFGQGSSDQWTFTISIGTTYYSREDQFKLDEQIIWTLEWGLYDLHSLIFYWCPWCLQLYAASVYTSETDDVSRANERDLNRKGGRVVIY